MGKFRSSFIKIDVEGYEAEGGEEPGRYEGYRRCVDDEQQPLVEIEPLSLDVDDGLYPHVPVVLDVPKVVSEENQGDEEPDRG